MSRIGKQPIPIPSGVDVDLSGRRVSVKSAKGTLEHTIPEEITVTLADGELVVTRHDDEPASRALHGLTRALLANMVTGVTDGYRRELTLVGVGYRAALKGSSVELQVGFSHPVTMEAPAGISFEVPEPTKIVVSGIDKQAVGQAAADIRRIRPPEPYKGKGIRYTGEHVRRKAGKAGAPA